MSDNEPEEKEGAFDVLKILGAVGGVIAIVFTAVYQIGYAQKEIEINSDRITEQAAECNIYRAQHAEEHIRSNQEIKRILKDIQDGVFAISTDIEKVKTDIYWIKRNAN